MAKENEAGAATEFNPTEFIKGNALADAVIDGATEDITSTEEVDETDDIDALTLDETGEESESSTDETSEEEASDDNDSVLVTDDEHGDDNTGITPDAYTVLATEIGIEAKDKDEFVKKVKDSFATIDSLKKELEVVQASYSVGETVARMDSMIKLPNDELVRQGLKALGLTDQEVEQSFAELEEAGQIDANAANIRVDLRSKKAQYIATASQRAEQEKTQKEQERNKFVNDVKGAIDKVDKLFGSNIGKSKEETERIKGKAFEQYTTGKFFESLVGSPEKLAKLILWSTLEGSIEKHLEMKGANRERRRIINDQLGNASRPTSHAVINTEIQPTDGFDKDAFLKGL